MSNKTSDAQHRTTFSHPGFSGFIGVAREDITPPVGIYHRNWGAATHETAEGIHSPLTLTVITFQAEENGDPLVLAAADLGWWRDPKDEREFRRSVLDALNLDPARFMLNFSHTHAGPVLCRDDADKPGGHLIPPYLDRLRDATIATARAALDGAKLRTLDFAYGKCSMAANRDLPDPDGSERYLCGFNPSAPADDTLLVGKITEEQDVFLGALVNYACHPTTLGPTNRNLSPDFPGGLPDRLSQRKSRYYLFLQGASGELAVRRQYSDDAGIVADEGLQLGWAVGSTMLGMNGAGASQLVYGGMVESGAPLAMWKAIAYERPKMLKAVCVNVELPIKPEWRGETEEERQWEAAGDAASQERLRRRRRIRLALGGGETAKMPVWIWQVGDAFFVGHPNEAYSNLQIELRAAFPDTALVVMNVTNGWHGYLPPADCYGTDRYSVWQTPFDKGSLEILIARCKEEIARMRASADAPTPGPSP